MDTTEPHPARVHLAFVDPGLDGHQQVIKSVVEAEACSLSDAWVHYTDTNGCAESRPREQVIVVEWLDEAPERATDEDPDGDEAGAILREGEMPLPLSPLPIRRGGLTLLSGRAGEIRGDD